MKIELNFDEEMAETDKGLVQTRLCANGCTIYLPPHTYGDHHIERHYRMYLAPLTGIITLVPQPKKQKR